MVAATGWPATIDPLKGLLRDVRDAIDRESLGISSCQGDRGMRGSFGTDLRRPNANFLGSYGPAMRPRGSAGRRRIDNLGSASLDASHLLA